MTTDVQRHANRANAQKSTGPRTGEGKRKTAQNAYRHGLSRAPLRSEVMAWYKVITGTEFDEDLLQRGDEQRLAFNLAEAEAHLANAVREEERFLEALETGKNLALQLRRIHEVIEEIWHGIPGASQSAGRTLLARRNRGPYKVTHKIKRKWSKPDLRHERLARYRKAAEVRRHKALQAWTSAVEAGCKVQNEPKIARKL